MTPRRFVEALFAVVLEGGHARLLGVSAYAAG